MAAWIAINGEAIYGTRPWLVHGEGAVQRQGRQLQGGFRLLREGHPLHQQGDKTLYAFALGWPAEGKLVIRSLAKFPG